jgi:hypothetical protein
MTILDCIHQIPKDTLSLKDFLPYIVSIGLAIWNINILKKIEAVKTENEKKLHIDKAQFNKEFEIYSEIWSQLVDMRIVIEMLRPFLDNKDEGKTYEETIAARSRDAIEKGNLLISTVEKNKPFYARHVYANLTDLIGLMKNEIYEISNRDKENRNYWDDRKAGLSKFNELSDKICESIRLRIGQINAI